jgi:hypothetical protein
MWLAVAGGTVQRSITGEMFFAPCLGTNLYQRKRHGEGEDTEDSGIGRFLSDPMP